MSSHKSDAIETQLAELGRRPEWTHGVVNPPVYHASTCIFPSLADLDAGIKNPDAGLYYGRRGTPTSWALEEALTVLEPGAAGTKLFPSGLAAISASLLAVLKTGDHLLMVDSVYEPTRTFCDNVLRGLGIETTYYNPQIGSNLSSLMRPNTRVVFTESPGSLTFEVQDLPALAKIAHAHDAFVILDNTWATPLFFKGLEHGADMVMQSLTKYVIGHSDALMGAVTASAPVWPRLKAAANRIGFCVGPDDAALALRGLRTLAVRLERHQASALRVARWLQSHPHVASVLHPALSDDPGHALWKRDFTGSSGLFSFVLRQGSRADLAPFVDRLRHFKMGFSWGGYESLILPVQPHQCRTATSWTDPGPVLRLHIGLEDPDDLIADLAAGLDRYAGAMG